MENQARLESPENQANQVYPATTHQFPSMSNACAAGARTDHPDLPDHRVHKAQLVPKARQVPQANQAKPVQPAPLDHQAQQDQKQATANLEKKENLARTRNEARKAHQDPVESSENLDHPAPLAKKDHLARTAVLAALDNQDHLAQVANLAKKAHPDPLDQQASLVPMHTTALARNEPPRRRTRLPRRKNGQFHPRFRHSHATFKFRNSLISAFNGDFEKRSNPVARFMLDEKPCLFLSNILVSVLI